LGSLLISRICTFMSPPSEKALWLLLIGIIFVVEVAWILLLVYLPFALVR
jgi:hypothetical protein